jgi:lipopolysaccharide/colanic/teichoic acid biosynthesis glycosyltransferase
MNKNIFSLFKLRTMHLYSESKGNTVKNDQRIYTFAKFIRKYRLDEFPQIINILLGDMHLVGPRAEWVKLSDEYSEHIKNYYARNIVRPGITGWAQILYQYGFDINDSKQKLMYELYYIKNWSIWLELEICIKTISVILDKKGF